MRMGASRSSGWALLLGLAMIVSAFLPACGSGGGGSGIPDLWVRRFSVPNFTGILLDEALVLNFSSEVDETSLNHDSVRIRTGTTGGEAPRGVFVKGIFLIDPNTGSRVVIDPDQVSPAQVAQAERDGLVSLIPVTARYDYDPAMKSPFNGNRQVLFDHSRGDTVTFVPEIPTRTDLTDTGLKSSATYSVVVPAFPSLNTVQTIEGDPCLPRDGMVFVSTFTTVPVTSMNPFLGGECDFPPRVVNTSPPNFATSQDSKTRIYIRFSQPLDPRSIASQNIYLIGRTLPGEPQIPTSLFLRQTRVGTVEVIMTPLIDLPVSSDPNLPHRFEVTLGPGIRDLLNQPLVPYIFSFSTSGDPIQVQPIVETFANNSKEDLVDTSANWNGTKDYVGAETGALVASYAPYAGSGTDGDFVPPVGEVTYMDTGTGLVAEVFNYTSINIGIGATVYAQGNFGLVMRCQGSVLIEGELLVSGLAGGTGGVGSAAGDPPSGGAGGSAGPGGTLGGTGGMFLHDAAYFDGHNGGGSGGGYGGHSGDQERDDGNPANRNKPEVRREGGGGGGYSTAGGDADVSRAKTALNPNIGGTGGAAVSLIVPPTVGRLDAGFGGFGGGGGGGEDDVGASGSYGDGVSNGYDEGGGGGGGGGGGLQIVAYGDITVKGKILANGGVGGSTYNPSTGGISQGAPGGGGSGGAVWLQTSGDLTIVGGSQVRALGGLGGQGDGNGNDNPRYGGPGANGFIVLQDADGSYPVGNTGDVDPAPTGTTTFNPPIILDSEAVSLFYDQYASTPNYGDPEFDYDLGPAGENNVIRVYFQGSRLNMSTLQPWDPDLDPGREHTTNWIPLFDSTLLPGNPVFVGDMNVLDNYQYVRFWVEFSVDPTHDFADPLPKITEIRVPVSSIPD